jgi:uncharacterized glyoxalase superfamily protein PhnB
MSILALKPFIPSGPDFRAAKAFFRDLGFSVTWENEGYAELRLGAAAFILQDLQNSELQHNLMMLASVEDLDDWWQHILASGVLQRYPAVEAKGPTDYPWGQREVHLIDPAGVCWHFA